MAAGDPLVCGGPFPVFKQFTVTDSLGRSAFTSLSHQLNKWFRANFLLTLLDIRFQAEVINQSNTMQYRVSIVGTTCGVRYRAIEFVADRADDRTTAYDTIDTLFNAFFQEKTGKYPIATMLSRRTNFDVSTVDRMLCIYVDRNEVVFERTFPAIPGLAQEDIAVLSDGATQFDSDEQNDLGLPRTNNLGTSGWANGAPGIIARTPVSVSLGGIGVPYINRADITGSQAFPSLPTAVTMNYDSSSDSNYYFEITIVSTTYLAGQYQDLPIGDYFGFCAELGVPATSDTVPATPWNAYETLPARVAGLWGSINWLVNYVYDDDFQILYDVNTVQNVIWSLLGQRAIPTSGTEAFLYNQAAANSSFVPGACEYYIMPITPDDPNEQAVAVILQVPCDQTYTLTATLPLMDCGEIFDCCEELQDLLIDPDTGNIFYPGG